MKRRGVIAALAALAAAAASLYRPYKATGQDVPVSGTSGTTTTIGTTLSNKQQLLLFLTDDGSADSGITWIEVRYKNRVVRLTAAEIMDALEGK